MTPVMLAGLWVAAAYILTLSIKELEEKTEPGLFYSASCTFLFLIISLGSTGIYIPAQDKIISSPASAYGGVAFFIMSVIITFLTILKGKVYK